MNKKKIIVILAVVFIAGAVFNWFFTHSYLEVEVSGSPNGELTYNILDQKSKRAVEVSTSDRSIRKLVKKSSYEVTVTQANKTHFATVSTGPFLKTSTLSGEPKAERAREFVGNNPSPCMFDTGTTLLSYTCTGSFEDINIHVPATAATPTTIRKPTHSETSVDSIVDTANGPLIMVSEAVQGDIGGVSRTIYPLRANVELEGGTPLAGLSIEQDYSIEPYLDGYIVYPEDFSTIEYYEKPGAKSKKLDIKRPENTRLKPVSLSVNGNSVAILYSENKDKETDLHSEEAGLRNEVVVFDGNESKNFALKGLYSSLMLCGNNKLCGMTGYVINIFDMSEGKLRKISSVTQAEAFEKSGSSLLIVRSNEVLSFDVDKLEGFVSYSLGDYTYCGIAASKNSYVLCVINRRQDKVALRINNTQEDKDSIDKKLSDLLKSEDIKNLSAYGRFIFISPELGKPVFDNSTGFFGYDKDVKKIVNTRIRQEIGSLGLSQTNYDFINPFE